MFVNVSPSFADVCLRFLAQGPSRRLRVASSSSASPVQTRVDLIPRPRRTPHLQIWPNLYAMAQAVSSVFFPAPCNHPFARALGEAGEFLAAPTSHPVLLLMHDVRRPVVALVRPAGGGSRRGSAIKAMPSDCNPGESPVTNNMVYPHRDTLLCRHSSGLSNNNPPLAGMPVVHWVMRPASFWMGRCCCVGEISSDGSPLNAFLTQLSRFFGPICSREAMNSWGVQFAAC